MLSYSVLAGQQHGGFQYSDSRKPRSHYRVHSGRGHPADKCAANQPDAAATVVISAILVLSLLLEYPFSETIEVKPAP